MGNLHVREIRNEEFGPLGQLMMDVYSKLDGFPSPIEQPSYYEMLRNIGRFTEKRGVKVFVALSPEAELIGGVVYFGDMSEYGSGGTATSIRDASGIRLLGVKSEARGLGAGKALANICLQAARDAGHSQVILHTTQAMPIAWGMYERLGFKRSKDLDFMQGELSVFGFRLPIHGKSKQYTPYFRESGSGTGIVCIHSNASSSSQWRSFMERMSPAYRVFTPDSFGAGKSPAWAEERALTLHDEVALLSPIFEMAGDPFYLVGHSYGAGVALRAALEFPERVRAIAVYEPTIFALLKNDGPELADGIRSAVSDAGAAVAKNDLGGAAERFIDYWMGEGAWRAMPEARQLSIQPSMVSINRWGDALFSEPTPLHAFRALNIPVLYMVGAQSPASSLGVADVLIKTLPQVTVMRFADMGHMGPVTHPHQVNEAIAKYFARQ